MNLYREYPNDLSRYHVLSPLQTSHTMSSSSPYLRSDRRVEAEREKIGHYCLRMICPILVIEVMFTFRTQPRHPIFQHARTSSCEDQGHHLRRTCGFRAEGIIRQSSIGRWSSMMLIILYISKSTERVRTMIPTDCSLVACSFAIRLPSMGSRTHCGAEVLNDLVAGAVSGLVAAAHPRRAGSWALSGSLTYTQ